MFPKEIPLAQGKKLFFASDFHLGTPSHSESLEREKKITRWLNDIRKEAHTIFLLGDVFDFWFEYRKVVPKGFVRLQGKLAELSDEGINLVMFRGNHDMWMFDYFKRELNVEIISGTVTFTSNGKVFLIGHGDGLGPGDYAYKILKAIFNNRICQFLFGALPPFFGMSLAHSWSRTSRIQNNKTEMDRKGGVEMLEVYCQNIEKEHHHDYYVFGHRHKVMQQQVGEDGMYYNLGEWVNDSVYGVFDGKTFTLKTFHG